MIFTNFFWALLVASDQVEARRYFLMELQAPAIIWGIRIVLVLAALMAAAVFIKMQKHKKEE